MKFTPRIKQAIDLVSILHQDQLRKDKLTPYVSHVYGVAFILANYTDNEDVVIAGLLHDVLEDVDSSKYDAGSMRRDFGPKVVDMVLGVTEDKNISDWRQRKDAYLAALKADSQESLLISAADLTHNIRSISQAFKEHGEAAMGWFKAASKAEMLEVWQARINEIKTRLDSPITSELEQAYQEFVQNYA